MRFHTHLLQPSYMYLALTREPNKKKISISLWGGKPADNPNLQLLCRHAPNGTAQQQTPKTVSSKRLFEQ